jgi:hypothetical protein
MGFPFWHKSQWMQPWHIANSSEHLDGAEEHVMPQRLYSAVAGVLQFLCFTVFAGELRMRC